MRNQADGSHSALVESRLRKQAMAALVEREARFRKFFEENSSVMLFVDPSNGQIVAANRAAAEYYGYTQAQLTGMYTNQINTAPEQEVAVNRERSLRGELGCVNYRIRRADGEERDVEVYATRFDADGRQLLYAIIHDITDRKRAVMALTESEARFRKMFDENCSIFLLIEPSSGQIVEVNRAAMAFYGYERERLISMTIDQINVSPPEEVESQRLRALRQERNFFNFRHRLASGEERDVEIYSSPIVIDSKPLLFSVVHDVTDRRRAEEALQENRDFLNEAQRIGALGWYVLDIPAGVWTSSEALDRILDIDREYDRTVAGWAALNHPDDRAMMTDYFANEVLKERRPFDKEYRIVRPNDQAVRWVHGMGSVEFDFHGQPTKMRGIIQDITERKLAEIQIRESEDLYRATFEQAPVGILHAALDGRILRCNARFAEIIGYSTDEVPNLCFQQITFPGDLASNLEMLQRLSEGTIKNSRWEKRYIRKDGSMTWVRLTISTMGDHRGSEPYFVTLVEEINAIKVAEERLAAATKALQRSEAHYRTIFQTSVDGICISRLLDGRFLDANQEFLRILGIEQEELVGRTLDDLDIDTEPGVRSRMAGLLARDGSVRGINTRYVRKDGEIVWVQISASLIEIEGIPCVLSIVRDVSGAKAAEEEIRSLAHYDPLTGLPNRRLLLDRLHQAVNNRTVRMRALLFVDLDNFKTVNDTLGHGTGDLLLLEVARRLTVCVRASDTVARLGGDEFVVMLEGLSYAPEQAAQEAMAISEKILEEAGRPYLLDDRKCLSTSSIGIAVFGDRQETVDEVMQQADIALYQAKMAGRNTARLFSPALQAAVHARAAMEEDLRQGIEANQFELYYQPQIDLGRLIGAEALLRWNHPRRGTLLPSEFISVAEDAGLILPLGDWVMQAACRQIANWADRGETNSISVAVNISALQLHQPGFVESVLSALDHTGADPQNLTLELTESMLVENVEEIIGKMTELKSHGLRFSLDDFGTGYSSLSYLKRLPLDYLKIDRSFVRDILVDESSGAIAQTIISLSSALGLSVIAEGVETEDQRDFLAGMGCYTFQGYLFSRPVPLDEFEQLLSGNPNAAATPNLCN